MISTISKFVKEEAILPGLFWNLSKNEGADVPDNSIPATASTAFDETSYVHRFIKLEREFLSEVKTSDPSNATLLFWVSNKTLLSEQVNSNISRPYSIKFSDEAAILVPLYATIFLLSVVGNSLVMLTLLKNRRMRTPMNVLLLNLAISDLLLGVICMPFTLSGFLLRDFIFGAFLCRIIPYLQAVSVSVSAYTLVTISFERYFGICYPLKTRHWRSLSHAYKMISLVWAASFLFTVPIAITSELKPLKNSGRHKCREEWSNQLGEQIFNMFLDIVLLIAPLFLMITLYFKISKALLQHILNEQQSSSNAQHLNRGEPVLLSIRERNYTMRSSRSPRKPKENMETYGKASGPESPYHDLVPNKEPLLNCRQEGLVNSTARNQLLNLNGEAHGFPRTKTVIERNFLRKTNTKQSLQNKKRIIKMLFVVVLEFFVCWTPLYIINTISLFNPSAVYRILGMGGISAFQLLAYCSSFCNPITYCFMNASFRRAFLSAIGCKKEMNSTQCDELQIFSRNT